MICTAHAANAAHAVINAALVIVIERIYLKNGYGTIFASKIL